MANGQRVERAGVDAVVSLCRFVHWFFVSSGMFLVSRIHV
jgi:hypothetical protein